MDQTAWSQWFFDTFRQARQTKDGGYIAVGESNVYDSQFSDIYIVKTDSNGNLLWQKRIGTFGQIEQAVAVFETKDRGYIISGNIRDDRVASNRNTDPLIYKVDSLGIVQWSYLHDTPYDDVSAYAIQTFDSNYVFSSGISTSKGSSAYSKPALFKLDQSGNLIWLKKYGSTGANTGLMMVKELPDSSLIAVGRRVDGITIKGLMVHADKDGDSLFIETYQNRVQGVNDQNYLWDVIQMPDKGFMAVGEVIGLPPSSTYRQDAWVIRVDSNGCIMSSCLVGEKSLDFRKETLDIYPNPTNGIVNIETELEIKNVQIFNVQGQKVLEIKQVQNSFLLPEQNGIYFLRIVMTSGEVVKRKVIRN